MLTWRRSLRAGAWGPVVAAIEEVVEATRPLREPPPSSEAVAAPTRRLRCAVESLARAAWAAARTGDPVPAKARAELGRMLDLLPQIASAQPPLLAHDAECIEVHASKAGFAMLDACIEWPPGLDHWVTYA